MIQQTLNTPPDFYTVNNDFIGARDVRDSHEVVQFQNNSSIRIWHNEQDADFELHWHTALEIIMPIENHYDVVAKQISFHLMPNEILVIPSGEMHHVIAPDSGRRFIFLFDPSPFIKLKGFSGIQPLLAQPLYITQNTYPLIYDDLFRLLNQMQNEYFHRNEFAELTIYSLLLNFFVILGRDHINTKNPFLNVRLHKQHEYIEKFNDLLDYIDLHCTEDLVLDDLADMVGFSKYHFSRLFKQYTDFSFTDYVNYRRVKMAEKLLEKPELPVTDIALQSGFNSISTFNRLFRKVKNCTPSEYRSMNASIHF